MNAFNNLIPKIMGVIVIILTLALGVTIYTTNATIVAWTQASPGTNALSDFIGMEVVSGFGAFLIIFGLLISGGMLTLAGVKGKMAGTGTKDLMWVVGSVILMVVLLSVFPTILDYAIALLAAAVAASDALGEVGFGIIPVIVYLAILTIPFATTGVRYARRRKGKRSSRVAYA